MKFEHLPNEILIDCFEYFHTIDLLYSFGRLNHRFNKLIQTLPLHFNFHHIERSTYDVICQHILVDLDVQHRIYSLRLSNENTPGQINDFLSKFSLDQFSNLRSLTFIDFHENDIQPLKEILPKLSQITTLHLLDCRINQTDFASLIPIDNLQTLSINSNLSLIERTIPINRLTLCNLSLDEICRLFVYTPLLQYLNISCIRSGVFTSAYHQSFRPIDLKHLILIDFQPTFIDFNYFLENMSNVQSLTIGSSTDSSMLDAHRWERLITCSLPNLINFRFKLGMRHRFHQGYLLKIFSRFQTSFWISMHHWYTECSIEKRSMIIYSNPYPNECGEIRLISKRYCNPLIDHSQTFKYVNKLVLSPNDLFEHGDYYFPNITSLIITRSLQFSTENEEERVIECLMKLMNFAHLRHLEFPLDCRTERPTLLFQILDLAPQLSSLRTKCCFFELLLYQPESSRYLNGRIQKLDISNYDRHHCQRPFKIQSLYRLLPNLEQLTISTSKSQDWLFILKQFSKLSSFRVHVSSKSSLQDLTQFKMQTIENDVIIDQTTETYYRRLRIIFGVWIRKKRVHMD